MDKNEILKRSRQENQGRHDERERDVLAHAGQMATAVGGLVCALIILLDSIFSDKVNFSTWAVYLSITGTKLLYKYIKLKKPHELIFGLLQLALAVTFIVFYIIRLVG